MTRPAPNAARRNAGSRSAILGAALELVAEVGYPKLTVEGIAARAGVGKQTIYRWWPSKGAVLFDALLTLSETPGRAAGLLPDTGDLAADLKVVLRATVEELNDPRYDAPMRALSTEIVHDPELAAALRAAARRPAAGAEEAAAAQRPARRRTRRRISTSTSPST